MEAGNMPFSRRMMAMVVVYQSYIQSGIAPLKLGLSEYPILLKLAFSGRDQLLCQNEMARELHRDKALIARAVRRLTQIGYLTTAPHPYHKSKKILRLTETGKEVAYQVREITLRWDDRVRGMFVEEEWEAFLSGFEKVAQATADLEKGVD